MSKNQNFDSRRRSHQKKKRKKRGHVGLKGGRQAERQAGGRRRGGTHVVELKRSLWLVSVNNGK